MTYWFQVGDRVKPNDEAREYYSGSDTDRVRRCMVTGIVEAATYQEYRPGDWTGSIEVIDQDGEHLHFKANCLTLDRIMIEEEPWP